MRRKIIFYIIVLVVLMLPGLYLKSLFGYLPSIFLLIVTGISFLYMFILKKSFSFFQASDHTSFERNIVQNFPVAIKNNSFFIYPRIRCKFYKNNLFGQVVEVTDIDTTLASKENRTFNFGTKFNHLGTYEVGISLVHIYDLFGIFYLTYKNNHKSKVTVKPRSVDVNIIDLLDVQGKQTNMSTSKSKMESDDYSGIREYVVGDPIKNIHWKISAHTQDYVVKLFESYTSIGITIYTDFEATGYSNDDLMSIYDCLVESTYSISNHMLDQSIEDIQILYTKDGEIQEIFPRSRTELDNAILDFPVISLSSNNQISDMLDENSRNQYGLDVIIVCTANLSDLLVENLIQAKSMRKTVYLIYIVPESKKGNLSEEDKLTLDSLSNVEIDCFVNSSADDLHSEEAASEYA